VESNIEDIGITVYGNREREERMQGEELGRELDSGEESDYRRPRERNARCSKDTVQRCNAHGIAVAGDLLRSSASGFSPQRP
jgi:hypothetical protein